MSDPQHPSHRLGPVPQQPTPVVPPGTAAAPSGDKYEQILGLADAIDATGKQLRAWAGLGEEILRDDDVTASAELSPRTWEAAEEDIRTATSPDRGLLGAAGELDADALVVRATVRTYRWLDELQLAAQRTLGSVAAGALDFLAPEVELGGSLLSAGLIETDSLDRDGVTAYLGELAREHPELMDHIAGGGGLLESLQLRTLLTAGGPRGEEAEAARAGGLRAAGLDAFAADAGHAVRDIGAGLLSEREDAGERPSPGRSGAPGSLADLIRTLETTETAVAIHAAAPGRYIAYLPGPYAGRRRLRLVSGDLSDYVAEAAGALAGLEQGARVMLVGAAAGGTAAVLLAASPGDAYVVDQVVTVGSPGAAAPRVPETTRVLSLEDRSDPVALLGGLVNAGAAHRLTVVYDGSAVPDEQPDEQPAEESRYVAGGRAADNAHHPELREEIQRLRNEGYLA